MTTKKRSKPVTFWIVVKGKSMKPMSVYTSRSKAEKDVAFLNDTTTTGGYWVVEARVMV